MAFHHTHGMDIVITRCSNNYGPYQFPEKLIPLMILNALAGQPLPVYGDGLYVRDWIHVEDHCEAVDAVLLRGQSGEVYNIGGRKRASQPRCRARDPAADRARRVTDSPRPRPPGPRPPLRDELGKIRDALGWRPRHEFDAGLAETVAWYRDERAWTERVRSGAYRDYYEQQYASRLTQPK